MQRETLYDCRNRFWYVHHLARQWASHLPRLAWVAWQAQPQCSDVTDEAPALPTSTTITKPTFDKITNAGRPSSDRSTRRFPSCISLPRKRRRLSINASIKHGCAVNHPSEKIETNLQTHTNPSCTDIKNTT